MLNAEYWWKNLREPVLFADAVTAAVRSGCRRVVELGPQPALLRMAADCAVGVGETVEVLPTLQRGVSSKRALMETLAHAWSQGLEPNWSAVYPGCCPHQSLPVHPWQRQTHWLEAPAVLVIYRGDPVVVEASFRIVEVLKGRPPKDGKVKSRVPLGGNCSIELLAAIDYLFFLNNDSNFVLLPDGSRPIYRWFSEHNVLLERLRALRK